MSTADFSTRFAGPFAEGDLALLIDSRGRQYLITLGAGQVFHSHFGAVPHDEVIGRDQGARVRSASGKMVIALKPSLSDYVMNMPRHSQIIYPKDAAAILFYGDMYPGATVFEAGLGSGALALALLRAVGPAGKLISYETRPDPLAGGPRNVERYLGESPNHTVRERDVYEGIDEDGPHRSDRARRARALARRSVRGGAAAAWRHPDRVPTDGAPSTSRTPRARRASRLRAGGDLRAHAASLAPLGIKRAPRPPYGRPYRLHHADGALRAAGGARSSPRGNGRLGSAARGGPCNVDTAAHPFLSFVHRVTTLD